MLVSICLKIPSKSAWNYNPFQICLKLQSIPSLLEMTIHPFQLHNCEPHFVRCLVPNTHKEPGKVEPHLIVSIFLKMIRKTWYLADAPADVYWYWYWYWYWRVLISCRCTSWRVTVCLKESAFVWEVFQTGCSTQTSSREIILQQTYFLDYQILHASLLSMMQTLSLELTP